MNKKWLVIFLVLVTVSFGGVKLSWDDNSIDETGFKIERSLDGETFEQIGIVETDITTFIDNDVSTGKIYFYRVCAFNEAGNSDYSNILKVDLNGVYAPVNVNVFITLK